MGVLLDLHGRACGVYRGNVAGGGGDPTGDGRDVFGDCAGGEVPAALRLGRGASEICDGGGDAVAEYGGDGLGGVFVLVFQGEAGGGFDLGVDGIVC